MRTKRKAGARKGKIQYAIMIEVKPRGGASFSMNYRTRRWSSKREALRALARALRRQSENTAGEVERVQMVDGLEQTVGRAHGNVATGISNGYGKAPTIKARS